MRRRNTRREAAKRKKRPKKAIQAIKSAELLNQSGSAQRCGVRGGTTRFSCRRRRPVPTPSGRIRIPWKGKPAEKCPDTPRCKTLGNLMAVHAMRWPGQRIVAQRDYAANLSTPMPLELQAQQKNADAPSSSDEGASAHPKPYATACD